MSGFASRRDERLARLVRAAARGFARFYPADFRRQYGPHFADVAEDRWRRERARLSSFPAVAATLWWLAADTASAILVARPSRDAREPSMFDRAARHLRSAVTLLRRSPLITAVATLSLAIGIGANVAVFSAANALLLARTRGIANPDRVVDVGRTTRGKGFDTVGYPLFADLAHEPGIFTGVFAVRFEPRAVSLGGADGAERVYAQQVSAGFFDVLGVTPALGGFFHGPDERLGTPLRRVVLSHAFWHRRFNDDPGVIDRELVLNGDRFTVAAVAADGFQGTSIMSPDLWMPLTAYAQATPSDALLRSRDSSWLVMGARLAPGVSIAQAQTAVNTFQQRLLTAYPTIYQDRGLAVAASSRVPGLFGEYVGPFVGILLALTGLVLVVACANLGSLLMARAAGRSRDVAVRLALGASRRSLVIMFLTESVVLFMPGALAALALAEVLTRLLSSLVTTLPVPVSADLSLDWRVLGFGLALSLGTALATGFAPAWQSARTRVVPDLKSDASAPRRQRLRSAFVIAQVACCLLLMVVAGLLVRGRTAAARIDPGFRIDGIDVASVDLSLAGYNDGALAGVTAAVRDRLAALPGVRSVSMSAMVPLTDNGLGLGDLRRAGDPASARVIQADWNVISPEFLPALDLPIVRGRNFSADDRPGAPLSAIVNETFAREVWPHQDPIGRRLESGNFAAGREATVQQLIVVGVARDAKYRALNEPPRQFIYVPLSQNPWTTPNFFIRRDRRLGDAAPFSASVRAALRDVNRNLPLVDLAPFRQSADLGLLPQRIAAAVAGVLGAVALVLSVIGIYGITAFAVASRTREIGVRVALGADARRVRRLVLGQALRLAITGSVIGLAGAAALGTLLSSMLFGVSPVDPAALGATTLLLIACTLVAAVVPAQRAARVNPVDALRA